MVTPRMVEPPDPPTRGEIEEILRDYDFAPSKDAAHVWTNPEGTKFLAFPEAPPQEGEEATAIYGDAELGEPGRALTFRQARAVVTGRLELDSPDLRRLALPEHIAALAALPPAFPVIEGELEEKP